MFLLHPALLLLLPPLCLAFSGKECLSYDLTSEEVKQSHDACDDQVYRQKDFKVTLKQDCSVEVTDSAKVKVTGNCDFNLPWSMFPCEKKNFQIKSDKVQVELHNKFSVLGKYGINCQIEKECVTKKAGRIVNGNVTNALEHPYFVTLIQDKDFPEEVYCGASLITDQIALTAAHCLYKQQNNYNLLQVASEEFVDCEKKYNTFKIAKWILHENYKDEEIHHDIALVKLEKPVTLSDSTQVIERYKNASPFPGGKKVVVTGWGDDVYNGESTKTVEDVELDTISNADCVKMYEDLPSYVINDENICTFTKGKDACQGDSGGPMVTTDQNGKRFLVGVVSAGEDCAKDHPGIFARVKYFNDWIDENMKKL